tara:strand:- start:11269 stop:11529 length:261 start_codon:yes stop_codon:yes gene_type:complete
MKIPKEKLNYYERNAKDAPSMPEYTCGKIDDQIASLEELRLANDDLRHCAEFWRDRCELLAYKLQEWEEWKKNLEVEFTSFPDDVL